MGLNIAIIAVSLLFCFFSSYEAALIRVRFKDIVAYVNRHGASKKTAIAKKYMPEYMVPVNFMLLLIDITAHAGSFLLAMFLVQNNGWLARSLIFLYPLVRFFFGEVISKGVGVRWAPQMTVAAAVPLYWTLRILFPLTVFLRWCNKLFAGQDIYVKEADVIATAQAAEEHGALHSEETSWIERGLKAGNHAVADFMIPLSECATVPLRPTKQELACAMSKSDYLVVCPEEGPQTVSGIVESKDLSLLILGGKPEERVDLKSKLKPTFNLPKSMPIPEALKILRKEWLGVVEEEGKTVGIIIRFDITDEMVGAVS